MTITIFRITTVATSCYCFRSSTTLHLTTHSLLSYLISPPLTTYRPALCCGSAQNLKDLKNLVDVVIAWKERRQGHEFGKNGTSRPAKT